MAKNPKVIRQGRKKEALDARRQDKKESPDQMVKRQFEQWKLQKLDS